MARDRLTVEQLRALIEGPAPLWVATDADDDLRALYEAHCARVHASMPYAGRREPWAAIWWGDLDRKRRALVEEMQRQNRILGTPDQRTTYRRGQKAHVEYREALRAEWAALDMEERRLNAS